VARTPTTTDAFNAVAEVRRRALLDALGTEEATVGDLVDRLGLSQPQVSKHLAVLRAVALVSVRVDGRRRWYRVNGPALQPVFEWVRNFESTWNNRLDRLDDVLVVRGQFPVRGFGHQMSAPLAVISNSR
jgi:DNA-binding transcriptional ArsR family regulator